MPRARRSLPRSLLAALLVAAAAVTFLAYLHTGHGFVHVLVPLLDRLLPADLTVGGGRLSLVAGTLEVRELEYRDGRRGFGLRIPAGEVRAPLGALLAGRIEITDLVARGVEIDVALGREGAPGRLRHGAVGMPGRRRAIARALYGAFPVAVERGRIDDASVRLWRHGRTRLLLRPAALAVDDLVGGTEATVRLHGDVALDPDEATGYAGDLEWSAALVLSEDRVVEVARVDALARLRSGAELAAPYVSFRSSLEGRRDAGVLAAAAKIQARREETALGEVSATLRGTLVQGLDAELEGPPLFTAVETAVAFEQVGADFLNPLVAPLGSGSLERGSVQGRVRIAREAVDEPFILEGAVEGQGLRLLAGDVATPLADVRVVHDVRWSPSDDQLDVRELRIILAGDGRSVLDARLLGADGGAEELEVRITGLDARPTRAWLRFLGLDAPLPVKTATLDGTLRFALPETGDRIPVHGEVDIQNLRLTRGDPDRVTAPLRLEATVRGAVEPGAGVGIEALRLSLRRGASLLASASVSGEIRRGPAGLRLDGALDAPELGEAAAALLLRRPVTGDAPGAGHARLDWRARGATADGEIALETRLEIGEVPVAGAKSVRRDLGASGRLRLGGGKVVVDELAVESRTTGGRTTGSMRVSGALPLGGAVDAERLRVALRDVEAAPLLEVAGVPLSLGPLPVSGDLEVRLGPDGELRIDGRERVGLRVGSGGTRDVAVAIEHGIVRSAVGAIRFDVGIESKDADGRAGRARASGQLGVRVGASGGVRPVRLEADFQDLDLGPWLELAGWLPRPEARLRLDGALAATLDDRARLTVTGEQRIGFRAVDGRPVTLELTHQGLAADDRSTTFDVGIRMAGQAAEEEGIKIGGRYTAAASPPARPALDLTGRIDAFDLTPLGEAFDGAPRGGTDGGAKPGPLATAGAPGAGRATLPLDVRATVSITALRYDRVRVEEARASADLNERSWQMDLAPSRLAQGTVSASLARRFEPGSEALEATLDATAVDLKVLLGSFRATRDLKVEGRLDLSAALAGRAPAGVDVMERLDGPIKASVRHGRLEGMNLMAFLAARTGVAELTQIPLDSADLDVEVRVADGVAHIERCEVAGSLARLEMTGEARRERLDARIHTYVGPGLARTMSTLGVRFGLFETVVQLLGVPVAVRVAGPYESLTYTAEPAAGRGQAASAGTGGLKRAGDLVRGTVGRIAPGLQKREDAQER